MAGTLADTWQTHGKHMANTWPTHGRHMAMSWQTHGIHHMAIPPLDDSASRIDGILLTISQEHGLIFLVVERSESCAQL